MLFLVSDFVSCGMVFLLSKAILTLVCLIRLVNFLMCGELYVKVDHLVLMSVSLFGDGWVFFFCFICCFNLIRSFLGTLFCAVSSMVFHSLSFPSLVSGRVSILSM